MNKKICILSIALLGVIMGYLTFDPYTNRLCTSDENCLFLGWRLSVSKPLFLISLSIVVTTIGTFFISDRIFARWITFAIVWMIMAVSAIAISPIYSPYIFGGPTKESVSIWMGALFVIISLTMFAVMTWRERRHV